MEQWQSDARAYTGTCPNSVMTTNESGDNERYFKSCGQSLCIFGLCFVRLECRKTSQVAHFPENAPYNDIILDYSHAESPCAEMRLRRSPRPCVHNGHILYGLAHSFRRDRDITQFLLKQFRTQVGRLSFNLLPLKHILIDVRCMVSSFAFRLSDKRFFHLAGISTIKKSH